MKAVEYFVLSLALLFMKYVFLSLSYKIENL